MENRVVTGKGYKGSLLSGWIFCTLITPLKVIDTYVKKRCMFKSSTLSILGMLYPKWNESRERQRETETKRQRKRMLSTVVFNSDSITNYLNCWFQFWFYHQLLLGFEAAVFVVHQFPQWQNSCIGLNFLIYNSKIQNLWKAKVCP